MALPTTTGDFHYPYSNSPARSFYQAAVSGVTDGVLPVLGTVSATDDFVLTKLMISVYDASAGASVTFKLKNESVFTFSGATIGTHVMDFSPQGLRATGADTLTADVTVVGVTAGCSCFITGYFD